MSTTDKAKEIRTELKQKYGWTGKQVSVRADYYSLGSSINITIKDPAIWIKKVEEIAEPKEEIHRDHHGEILNGGNRYVSVRYDHDVLKLRAAKYLPAVAAAYAKLEPDTTHLHDIEGTPYLLGRSQYGHLTLWGEAQIAQHYDANSVAEHIAILLDEEGHP